MQSVEFFDRHDPTDLTALISVELNSLRTFVFKCGGIALGLSSHHAKVRRSARRAEFNTLVGICMAPVPMTTAVLRHSDS